jgi:RNA polymerase sigma factor (sigma-70 family)
MDPRIVDEVRFRFQERFSKTEPYTEDEKDFVQQLFLTTVKARKRYDPGHASAATLYTFINRSLDRHIKYLDRTRLTDSRAVDLYAEDPEPVYEADYFCVRTSMRHEHYRQLNGERQYYQKPPHFNLGLDIACFAAEPWGDASSLRLRTTEILQTLSGHQRSAFELLIAGHTQKEIADTLEKSTSWAKRQAKHIRTQFGLKPKEGKLEK